MVKSGLDLAKKQNKQKKTCTRIESEGITQSRAKRYKEM